MEAARSGSMDVMLYLQRCRVFTRVPLVLTPMLKIAGARNRLAAAVWLRQQGAEWPLFLFHGDWSDEVLVWARVAGYTTPLL
jgi:hypothetical protein